VTFKAPRDKLEFHFSPSSLAADGLTAYSGEVDGPGPPRATPSRGCRSIHAAGGRAPEARRLVCSPRGSSIRSCSGARSPSIRSGASPQGRHGSVSPSTSAPSRDRGCWTPPSSTSVCRAIGSIDSAIHSWPRVGFRADISQRNLRHPADAAHRDQAGRSSPQRPSPCGRRSAVLLGLPSRHKLRALPDFGPIHTTDRAAVEFYDATGRHPPCWDTQQYRGRDRRCGPETARRCRRRDSSSPRSRSTRRPRG